MLMQSVRTFTVSGKKLREARNERHISQDALGRAVGRTGGTIWRAESAETWNFFQDVFTLLAIALKMTEAELEKRIVVATSQSQQQSQSQGDDESAERQKIADEIGALPIRELQRLAEKALAEKDWLRAEVIPALIRGKGREHHPARKAAKKR